MNLIIKKKPKIEVMMAWRIDKTLQAIRLYMGQWTLLSV